jgi:hypothetical protein
MRKQIFKNILFNLVNEKHDQHVSSLQLGREFDAFKLKTWHHTFDLDKVKDIPIFEILEKPTVKVASVHSFLEENDIKNALIKRAAENIDLNRDYSFNTLSDASTNTTSSSCNSVLSKSLNKTLLSKVK